LNLNRHTGDKRLKLERLNRYLMLLLTLCLLKLNIA